jgi:Histidine kinase-, DNA gyrase B-, and HSP90-like ATPase
MSQENIVRDLKANARPTKAFFVRMLTRDITLEDCILDLIDNSVDGAWASSGAHPTNIDSEATLQSYQIEVNISTDHFEVKDNCGGISLDDAVNYAFTFGRLETDIQPEFSVGVYGIGMKRSIFKLGEKIRIESTYSDSAGETDSFAVPISVVDWLGKVDWDFDIEPFNNRENVGVLISIDKLTPNTLEKFSDPAFVQTLRTTISRDYLVPLSKGLTIKVERTRGGGHKSGTPDGSRFQTSS